MPFPLPSRLSALLRGFARDERGNVLIFTALVTPILITLAAGAIETHQVTSAKANIQSAADQAVIAALTTKPKKGERDGGKLRAIKRADRLFDVNLGDKRLLSSQRGQLTLTLQGERLLARYDVEARYKSAFGTVSPLDGTEITLSATAEVTRGTQPRLTDGEGVSSADF